MKKKSLIILSIIIIVIALWFGGIIPKQIGKIYGINYMKSNFPKMELEYVRKSLQLIYDYGFGVTLITKSDRVLRDIDLLKKINDKTKCVVQMTMTTYDDELCKKN